MKNGIRVPKAIWPYDTASHIQEIWTKDGTYITHDNSLFHRIDGPALIHSDVYYSWYVRGYRFYTNDSFQRAAKLSNEEMTILILKYGDIK